MHPPPNSLKFRYFGPIRIALAALFLTGAIEVAPAAEPLPYAEHFNPANGFKPAQRNLTAIFLQMAGSLEHFGTPEPYMRHVLAEQARIDARYKKATGKDGSSRPGYFTDEYLEKLVRKWNQMSQPLGLEPFAKRAGMNMRFAIMGSWNMSIAEKLAVEDKLTPAEAETYRKLLEKEWFEKRDFQTLDAFYGGGYDKLTELGKSQMSKRVWRGQQTLEKRADAIKIDNGGTALLALLNAHQNATVSYLEDKSRPKVTSDTLESKLVAELHLKDAQSKLEGLATYDHDPLFYSHLIKSALMKRVDAVRSQAKEPGQADAIIDSLMAIVGELVVLAQSEFEAAIYEQALDR